MGSSYRTLSASVEKDSSLEKQFEEFKSDRDMTNKSEAVRALVRSGLEKEGVRGDPEPREPEKPQQADQRANQQSLEASGSVDLPEINLIKRNEWSWVGLIFAYTAFQGQLLAPFESVFGDRLGLAAVVISATVIIAGIEIQRRRIEIRRFLPGDNEQSAVADS